MNFMKTELGSFKLRERKVTASLEYTAHPHLKTDKHPQRKPVKSLVFYQTPLGLDSFIT